MTTQLISPLPYDDYEPEMFVNENEAVPENEELIKQNEENQPPPDPYGIVNIVFYLLGTSILLPWFFFVTCNDYWMYRFRDLHNQTDGLSLVFGYSDNGKNRTSLQADFTSYISIASTVPSTLFLFVNMFYLRKFSIHWRIVISSVIVFIFFIETTVLVLFNSDSWQSLFFIITMSTIVVLNLATAVLQATLSALFMKFPVLYISASSSGQSLAGVFAAVAQIATLLINASPTKSTFLYFLFADIVILISFMGYLYIRKTEFYKYYADGHYLGNDGSIQYHRVSTTTTWISTISIFFCYVVTCSIYPSIAVLVCSMNMGMKSPWADEYFVPVITYLLYGICEYSGRAIAGVVQKPKGVTLVFLSIARVIFIPLLMLCNAQPRHHLPVLINSDLIYALITVFLAISNGYITTMTFIIIPNSVLVHEQEVASSMLITCLAGGLSIGSLLSFPLVNML